MGAEQFGRGIENETLAKNVEVDIKQDESNQFDADNIGADLSSGDYSTGEQNISGADYLVIYATETSGNSSSVNIQWTDGAGNAIGDPETPSALDGLSNSSDYAVLHVKSTHVNVSATGNSTDYDITVNAH